MSQKNNLLENAMFITGILVLLALLGYLGFEMFQKEKGPPSLAVKSQHDPALEKYAFRIEVENTGQETAESANLQFELYQDGKVASTAVMVLDYVPIKSKEVGWVVFSEDRKPGDSLVVSAISFLQP